MASRQRLTGPVAGLSHEERHPHRHIGETAGRIYRRVEDLHFRMVTGATKSIMTECPESISGQH